MPTPAPPYLQSGSPQHRFALLVVVDGLTEQVAAATVCVKPATARKWQERLRRKAALYLGSPESHVNYHLAARIALNVAFVTQVPHSATQTPLLAGK